MGDIGLEHVVGGLGGIVVGAAIGVIGGYALGEHINEHYLEAAHHLVKGVVDLVPMGVGAYLGGRFGGKAGLSIGDRMYSMKRRYY